MRMWCVLILVMFIMEANGTWEEVGERILNKISKSLKSSKFKFVSLFDLFSESGLRHIMNGEFKRQRIITLCNASELF